MGSYYGAGHDLPRPILSAPWKLEAKVGKSKGSKEELLALLAEFDTAMLVGVQPNGRLRARPMGLQHERLSDCDLWFVTADDTHKTDEIDRSEQVNVCCLRTRDLAYVSVSARARVERNPAEVRRLWKPTWKLWFGAEQPEDGGIVLIKLRRSSTPSTGSPRAAGCGCSTPWSRG